MRYSADQGTSTTSTGLRLRRAHEPAAAAEPTVTGLTFYSGTRSALASGSGHPQTYGGLRYTVSKDWSSTVEAAIDPALSAMPRGYTLAGQLSRSLSANWGVSLGLQYRMRELNALDPQAPVPNGLAVPGQAQWMPATTHAAGYELRLNYRYGERNTFGLTYGSGMDYGHAQPWAGAYVLEGRQLGFTGQHWLTPDWSLSYGLVAQEQRGQGLRLGLRYSF